MLVKRRDFGLRWIFLMTVIALVTFVHCRRQEQLMAQKNTDPHAAIEMKKDRQIL